VLLAGKGHEHSMIYGAERRPWSDSDVARALLREMGFAKPMLSEKRA
jgi:UDP-N-acetylmuramyl tripeptide synthase